MSLMSYYINQLEKFDPKLRLPLMDVSYLRDVPLLGGVGLADEAVSYQENTIGANGTIDSSSIPWLTNGGDGMPTVTIDGEKKVTQILPAGMVVSYSQIQLEKAASMGLDIDGAQLNALRKKYQFSCDYFAYVGDPNFANDKQGFCRSSRVSKKFVSGADTNARKFENKTPDQILADVNDLLDSAWQASGYAVMPNTLLLPPSQYSQLVSRKVSDAGNISILEFIKQNNIANASSNQPLAIYPVKWLSFLGESTSARMVAYNNDEEYLRFPLSPLKGFEPTVQIIQYNRAYAWAMGSIEIIYPETLYYGDGI